jgi:hypothetical protein
LGLLFEAGFADTIGFTPRTDHDDLGVIVEGDPPVVFGVVIEVVNFDFSGCLGLRIAFHIDDSGLEPSTGGMVGIDAVVDLDWLFGFPLEEDAIGEEINILIIPG